jgi:dUTP pyrophosphatase
MNLIVKVQKLDSRAKLPKYAHDGHNGDLAADLFSIEEVVIQPGAVSRLRTGIAIELPEGYGALVEDRSGLATRGITTLAGVIDPGYRGELLVVTTNLSQEAFKIAAGDRVAQLRIVRRHAAHFEIVDALSPSARDTKGFGSSGT